MAVLNVYGFEEFGQLAIDLGFTDYFSDIGKPGIPVEETAKAINLFARGEGIKLPGQPIEGGVQTKDLFLTQLQERVSAFEVQVQKSGFSKEQKSELLKGLSVANLPLRRDLFAEFKSALDDENKAKREARVSEFDIPLGREETILTQRRGGGVFG